MQLNCGQYLVREWRSSDRSALLRHANNRQVWRNLTDRFPHPYTDADADAWFALLAENAEPNAWAIVSGDTAIGGIGVELGSGVHRHVAEIGYWLGEAYWGRGIMTAVLDKTAEYAMARHALLRLEAAVFAWNPASMRVLEKCAFVREGVLRRRVQKDGEIIDVVMYGRVIEPVVINSQATR